MLTGLEKRPLARTLGPRLERMRGRAITEAALEANLAYLAAAETVALRLAQHWKAVEGLARVSLWGAHAFSSVFGVKPLTALAAAVRSVVSPDLVPAVHAFGELKSAVDTALAGRDEISRRGRTRQRRRGRRF